MKKWYIALLATFIMVMPTACSEATENQPTHSPNLTVELSTAAEPSTTWTVEELAATIEAAGMFWEDWWEMRGAFAADEHIDWSQWKEWSEDTQYHPLANGYSVFLPSSGFASLDDISTHLMQFYTQSWIDKGEFNESRVIMEVSGNYYDLFGSPNAPAFREYDGVLYILNLRHWTIRPDWATAIHTLVEQDGNHAIVETVVSTYVSGYDGGGATPTITYRFTFIDNKINGVLGEWEWAEDETHWQGFAINIGEIVLFAYRAEDVAPDRFDTLHSIDHSLLWGTPGHGEQMLIGTRNPIYNVSLIHFSNDFDADRNEDIFILTESHNITDSLSPSEALIIHNYTSLGTFPWSGISFQDSHGEKHFLAIGHDTSDSPYWYMMLDITSQMRFE